MEQSITFCKNHVVLFSMIDTDLEITQGFCSSVAVCSSPSQKKGNICGNTMRETSSSVDHLNKQKKKT